jgi:hypothetical protein
MGIGTLPKKLRLMLHDCAGLAVLITMFSIS